ncbi:ATP-binding protein, partial [Collinsella aerofaciens]
ARAAANLVANAAEHARSRVAVSCDVAGGYLVIEVADDGPGFSPAALERGCERLFTDDSSRSSRDGGRHYGLGLHAAAEAASAHGGSVSLANSPSGGAVATIAVPLCGA